MCDQMRSTCAPPEGYSWRFVWSVRVGKEDKRGDCERKEPKDGRRGVMVVRVQKGMSQSETEDVFVHEVAHSFDQWCSHGWAGDHSATFDIWHGRVHRRYHGMETG